MPKSQDVRQLVRLVGLALTLFTITVGVVAAAYGGWGYTVTIEDTNGSTVRGEDPYLPSCNGCPPFSGADLGAYNSSDTLTISASQAKTFKNNGSDVTGVTMQYQLDGPGGTVVAWGDNDIAFAFQANLPPPQNDGDQQWGTNSTGIGDLIPLLGSNYGTYTLSVRYVISGTPEAPITYGPFSATFTYEAPTATTIALYDVNSEADGLRATWATISEESTEGFDLFRSETVGELGTKVNEAMIPAQNSGAAVGASYDLLDTDVLSGRLYYYTLVVHDGDGTSQNIGPVEAVYESPTALTLGAMDSARPTPSGALALAGAGLLALGLAAVRRRRMAQRRRAAKA